MMYFTPELARLVGQRFYNSLIDGGWLLVSACELSSHIFTQFSCVKFSSAIAYHRELSSAKSKDNRNLPSQVTLASVQRAI